MAWFNRSTGNNFTPGTFASFAQLRGTITRVKPNFTASATRWRAMSTARTSPGQPA